MVLRDGSLSRQLQEEATSGGVPGPGGMTWRSPWYLLWLLLLLLWLLLLTTAVVMVYECAFALLQAQLSAYELVMWNTPYI